MSLPLLALKPKQPTGVIFDDERLDLDTLAELASGKSCTELFALANVNSALRAAFRFDSFIQMLLKQRPRVEEDYFRVDFERLESMQSPFVEFFLSCNRIEAEEAERQLELDTAFALAFSALRWRDAEVMLEAGANPSHPVDADGMTALDVIGQSIFVGLDGHLSAMQRGDAINFYLAEKIQLLRELGRRGGRFSRVDQLTANYFVWAAVSFLVPELAECCIKNGLKAGTSISALAAFRFKDNSPLLAYLTDPDPTDETELLVRRIKMLSPNLHMSEFKKHAPQDPESARLYRQRAKDVFANVRAAAGYGILEGESSPPPMPPLPRPEPSSSAPMDDAELLELLRHAQTNLSGRERSDFEDAALEQSRRRRSTVTAEQRSDMEASTSAAAQVVRSATNPAVDFAIRGIEREFKMRRPEATPTFVSLLLRAITVNEDAVGELVRKYADKVRQMGLENNDDVAMAFLSASDESGLPDFMRDMVMA